MIYMKLEDPPGANKKFSPKEFLCRHLKIVIALALISTAMSVTSLVIGKFNSKNHIVQAVFGSCKSIVACFLHSMCTYSGVLRKNYGH